MTGLKKYTEINQKISIPTKHGNNISIGLVKCIFWIIELNKKAYFIFIMKYSFNFNSAEVLNII